MKMQSTNFNILKILTALPVKAGSIGLLLFLLLQTGCKKLVDIDPPVTSINNANVYAADGTAAAVLTGIYINLSKNGLLTGTWGINTPGGPGFTSLSLLSGLSADELTLFDENNEMLRGYYRNALASNNRVYASFWNNGYNIIFTANSAIDGLANSTSLTPVVQDQLTGEAKFIRAFCYFYLVNLYDKVPLITGTDYKANALLPPTPRPQVYEQIITDLKDAQGVLSDGYVQSDALTGTEERVRPNKWAATALLARAYLYTKDWANAEAAATAVIEYSSLYSLSPSLDGVFLMNSSEAIWQLQPVNYDWNTEDARVFIIPETGPSNDWPVYLSNHLFSSFETGDQRKDNWLGKYTNTDPEPDVDYYYPFKYKSANQGTPLTEYHMVLRLGEQYLIRAEARAQQGKPDAAVDLNTIRTRAGLDDTKATTKPALLATILHERQVELFTEWGHRWLDLKRTNTVDAVMSTVTPEKRGTWSTNWQWYPVPLTELERNPNLVQNPGY